MHPVIYSLSRHTKLSGYTADITVMAVEQMQELVLLPFLLLFLTLTAA
jgi:hypothetical protein